ncbi:MAG: response regulator containing CheY-like receiver and domain [Anaerocolumna sp.]|jgi:two-component SAPR family response regulator|nr:response regulator containing CheY-like receiver and domain [Anaerocolumna sp.]
MKVVIIDDDEFMLIYLRRMLDSISDIQILGAFQCSQEAEKFLLSDNNVDIILIDVNMPEENGIDFVKRVLKDRECIKVVFITSHKEYALDAFEVYAFDYILKPVNSRRLIDTIEKIRRKLDYINMLQEPKQMEYLISISCFGGLDIRNPKGEVIKLPTSKSLELLSYLLINRGKFVSKWKIIEDLFSDLGISNAEMYLNTTIYKLRKSLQPYGLKEAIQSSNQCYKLELNNIYVDFIDFENKVTNLNDDFNNLVTKDAIEIEIMYTGDLFGDKAYQWSLSEKERFTAMYCSYAKELSNKFLMEKNYYIALTILKKLEKIDEYNEEINCLLMQAYFVKNDKSGLKRQFKIFQERLKRELDVTPSITTINIYHMLLKDINT